jgi:thymidylate synthase (FAD)
MKLIKPSVEILEQPEERLLIDNLKGTASPDLVTAIWKQIEIAGRTCYKSEDKITSDSAEKFVEMLINRGHTAMLEHGTVYLKRIHPETKWDNDWLFKYINNPYSEVKTGDCGYALFITTNYRVLLENNWLDDLQYLCLPTEHHEKRVSVRFVCCRAVSHELVRHRSMSIAQESQRYCAYNKDKFGNEITFIIPCWVTERMIEDAKENLRNDTCTQIWYNLLVQCEDDYLVMLQQGWQPQQARAVLPNALKTEIIMTGFLSDWIGGYRRILDGKIQSDIPYGFFPLRTTKTAHPQMQELAIPLYEQFKKYGYV